MRILRSMQAQAAEARKLVGHRRLVAVTPHTVTDPAALLSSLSKVRRQGYATVNEENIPGVLSVGAEVKFENNAWHAVRCLFLKRNGHCHWQRLATKLADATHA